MLIDQECQASIMSAGDYVYFSNPASKVDRVNMTVRRGSILDNTLIVAPIFLTPTFLDLCHRCGAVRTALGAGARGKCRC